MPLVPSCQIYPASLLDLFQISFSRFYGSRLQIFRYSSSFPSKKHNLYVNQNTINSDSIPEKYPRRKPGSLQKTQIDRRPVAEGTSISQSTSNGRFSRYNWIEKWSETLRPKLPKQPQVILDYRYGSDVSSEDEASSSTSTMVRIVEKLKRCGCVDDVNERKERAPEKGSVEDIFYVEEGMLPNARGGFSVESPLGFENGFGGNGDVWFPWKRPLMKEEYEGNSVPRQSRTSLAKLTLPEVELRRLRHLTFQTKQRTKIGGAGVNQAIVDLIHEKWKTSEVVRLKCEGAPALNMKRMHEILERKTGGLVIWRSGTSVSLYRGVCYDFPSMPQARKLNHTDINSCVTATCRNSSDPMERDSDGDMQLAQGSLVSVKETEEVESLPEIKYENEIDKLLDGLGPRYTDWPGCDPLPVDADLLPGVVPDYKPPFRILPYGVRSALGLKEETALRRLARILPPHFALGRSRQHQGLAMAIVKLWERSSIAKIALKHGVQLTISERMAADIKKLTGGTLLSRNKDYIVFFRGKNFLSFNVQVALLERERLVKALQGEEEKHARLRAASFFVPNVETTEASGTADTLGETLEADAQWGMRLDNGDREMVMRAAEVARHANFVRKIERKLACDERKLMKAEQASAKVEVFLKPLKQPTDLDCITDKERFMFRKIGLRMKAFVFLGRRGVFDGTVEKMHLHWKYRELVKVIVKFKTFDQAKNIALSLEVESRGILVSVDNVSKGFAIIVFRGKDYQRPCSLRLSNLLRKRKALIRSIELQMSEVSS